MDNSLRLQLELLVNKAQNHNKSTVPLSDLLSLLKKEDQQNLGSFTKVQRNASQPKPSSPSLLSFIAEPAVETDIDLISAIDMLRQSQPISEERTSSNSPKEVSFFSTDSSLKAKPLLHLTPKTPRPKGLLPKLPKSSPMSSLSKITPEVSERSEPIVSPVISTDHSLQSSSLIESSSVTQYQGHFPWTSQIHDMNFKIFGNSSFRPLQEEAINSVLSGQNLLVLFPTGAGKSLIFYLPAVFSKGLTLVISPLIALIQDQVSQLEVLNIPVAELSSNTSASDQNDVNNQLSDYHRLGRLKLLYVTPEKIAKSQVLLNNLKKLYSDGFFERIVVDESHCLSTWGHDFRKDYLKLSILREEFPNVPLTCLTATATSVVEKTFYKF
ncbi:hypothetical protein GEMRC1_006550 [Eukaryota sp. GEM-RC1]